MKLSFTLTTTLAICAIGCAQAQTELQIQPNVSRPIPPTMAPAPVSGPLLSEQPSHYHKSNLNIEVGWGAPYGFGVSYGYMLTPHLDLNAGLGIGAGAKIGVGARYFLLPQNQLSPYFGVSLARTGRLDNIEVTLDQERAVYNMAASGVLHLRGGLRWQPGRLGLLGTAGYGARFTGDPITYHAGYFPSARMNNLVKVVSPGGLEISLGLIINLGPR